MSMLLIFALMLPISFTSPTVSDSVAQLQTRANQGDSRAQFWLGVAYQRGNGIGRDERLAVKWILRAAVSGNADAQNAMGQAYEEGEGVNLNFASAARWYRDACENRPDLGGAGQGCNNLGLLYFYGKGVPRDFPLAYLYARMARNQQQAALCAQHITSGERRNADLRYSRWVRLHGEEVLAQR